MANKKLGDKKGTEYINEMLKKDKEHKEKLAQRAQDKQENQTKYDEDCTFTPDIHLGQKHHQPKNQREEGKIYENLYQQREKKEATKDGRDPNEIEFEKAQQECTFKPEIGESMKKADYYKEEAEKRKKEKAEQLVGKVKGGKGSPSPQRKKPRVTESMKGSPQADHPREPTNIEIRAQVDDHEERKKEKEAAKEVQKVEEVKQEVQEPVEEPKKEEEPKVEKPKQEVPKVEESIKEEPEEVEPK